ncbi:STAS domain-containing protein [Actinosynnema sp. NPDC023587]|uniref:STAS domain-containing protein n=1 Tax=Actinosynnema sp. NPDC023587 TaxID=3154695 RepID=UPI0033CB3830
MGDNAEQETTTPTADTSAVQTAEPDAVQTAEPDAVQTAEPDAVQTAEPAAEPDAAQAGEPAAETTADTAAVQNAEAPAVPTDAAPWARVDTVADGRAVRVRVGGDIDQKTVKALQDGLDEGVTRAADIGARMLVVDLDEAGFLASVGLSALINAHHRLHEADRELVVVLAEDHKLVRLLWTTALNHVVTVVSSLEAALAER